MRRVSSTVIAALAATATTSMFAVGAIAQSSAVPPPWAYGFAAPAPPPPPAGATPPARGGGAGAPAPPPAAPDTTLLHLEGSSLAFTAAQVRNGFGPADWFPNDHPAMPNVVSHGKPPDARACGLCHYPNGKGRPENAPVAGLPASYIVQQMLDFRGDKRTSADSRKANTGAMTTIAKAMTEEEINQVAVYFSSMKFTPWVTVKETDTVPKTRIAAGLFLNLDDGTTEPLGNRIIEVPVKTESTETLRDPHSGFIAYAPKGSIKKGEALVTSGGAGKTIRCALCHGADLNGLGPVPGIAGRSPSYLVRQMFDMQQGNRKGLWTDLMKGVVAKLTDDDMLTIAAYVASQKP